MPGNIPPETGNIEFVDSGQINMPEIIDTEGAPLPENKNVTIFDAYFAKIEGDKYQKISWAGLEDEIYVVVKTAGLVGKTIEINIIDRDAVLTKDGYGILAVLQDDLDKKGEFSTKVRNDGFAIFKLQLKPSKEEKDIKIWRDKINKTKDKLANLCILVDWDNHVV